MGNKGTPRKSYLGNATLSNCLVCQIFTVRSADAEAKKAWSGEITSLLTAPLCSFRVVSSTPSLGRQAERLAPSRLQEMSSGSV